MLWLETARLKHLIINLNEKEVAKPTIIIEKTLSKKQVEIEIRKIAREKGFDREDYLVALANCESTLNPKATHINKPSGSVDRGLFQWNNYYQKQVSDECAYDIRCSTEKAIEKINAGGEGIWVCNNKIKTIKGE